MRVGGYAAFGETSTLDSNNLRKFERVKGLLYENWI